MIQLWFLLLFVADSLSYVLCSAWWWAVLQHAAAWGYPVMLSWHECGITCRDLMTMEPVRLSSSLSPLIDPWLVTVLLNRIADF